MRRATSALTGSTVIGAATVTLALMTGSVVAHDPITTRVSWEREIAPIVEARCVSCHSPGGPAPMSLATYEDARPWARAIREEVLARRMPKWPVVRGYGDFTNDPSLSPFEIALVTAWVDGGAPRKILRPTAARPAVSPTRVDAPIPTADRTRVIACDAVEAPSGTLLGIRPDLPGGAALEVTLRHADGREEPLVWLRDFSPKFPTTLWLRRPVDIAPGSAVRMVVTPDAACRLHLFYGQP